MSISFPFYYTYVATSRRLTAIRVYPRGGVTLNDRVASRRQLEEKERLQRRKERFGIVSPEEAKAKRGERFSVGAGRTSITAPANSDPAAEEKKRSRALRFGST